MCGVTGIFQRGDIPVSAAPLRKMTGAVAHRCPDGEVRNVRELRDEFNARVDAFISPSDTEFARVLECLCDVDV